MSLNRSLSDPMHSGGILPHLLSKHLPLLGSVIFWVTLWVFRERQDRTRWQDLWVSIGVLVWKSTGDLSTLLTSVTSLWDTLPSIVQKAGYAAVALYALSTLQDLLGLADYEELPKGGMPWLLPSRTSHMRMFPEKHSFSHSYLQVAVPVESEGRFGNLISIGNMAKKGWFHVEPSDYLERISKEGNLKSRLAVYLQAQGVEDSRWDHAYLLTAPRFLGYAFNPVSFWYIYDSSNTLTMMILEVNNTFDERRIYLLEASDEGEASGSTQDDLTEERKDVPPKFKNAWTKDFHVSPFNSRKGAYSLTASDPFQDILQDSGPIFDNLIVLKSSKDHVKLTARVFSEGKPINSLTVSREEMIKFICSWFWVGLVTFPRILKEAALLFFKRGLSVWLRPEILPTSIGRREEVVEIELAKFFEAYLESLLMKYKDPITVRYISPLQGTSIQHYANTPNNAARESAQCLEIRVLSPAFYSRFIHYAHTSEAFDRECVFTDEKNRTILLSQPHLLALLISSETVFPVAVTRLENIRWTIHRWLRCPPAKAVYGEPVSSTRAADIRYLTLSPLDHFVMVKRRKEASEYRRLCARVFLAQRFTFGFVSVVDFVDMLIRIGLIWAVASESRVWAWGLVHLWALGKG